MPRTSGGVLPGASRGNGKQLFIERADLLLPIHKVDLKYPMPSSAVAAELRDRGRVFRMDIERPSIFINPPMREHPNRVPGNHAAKLPTRFFCQTNDVVEYFGPVRKINRRFEIFFSFGEGRFRV